MGIHKNGFWLNEEKDGHFFDKRLSKELLLFLEEEGIKSLVDFGCGKGTYSKEIKDSGFMCECYDGNPNTSSLTGGLCEILDLSLEFNLGKLYDCVLSLEVGEHIPKEFEKVYLKNLSSHSKKTIILSWAIPGQGGRGHVNERSNEYIQQEFSKLGFERMIQKEDRLRSKSTLKWFKKTIMVYQKV